MTTPAGIRARRSPAAGLCQCRARSCWMDHRGWTCRRHVDLVWVGPPAARVLLCGECAAHTGLQQTAAAAVLPPGQQALW